MKKEKQLPSSLSSRCVSKSANEDNRKYALEKQKNINDAFKEMKIKAHCDSFVVGPQITRFNIEYENNETSKKITKALRDLEIRLGGLSLRFVEIIPNCSYSGLEIPNLIPETISFKEGYESLDDVNKHPLNICLGKYVDGRFLNVDLDDCHNLLVAGTYSSGSDTFIHSLITSLIMRNSPNNLKLVLIDSRNVEMNIYRDIPHLLCPIINDRNEALSVLKQIVKEIDDRYERFMSIKNCWDIEKYNEWANKNNEKVMPYIAIFIDACSGLIDCNREISELVISILQCARAVGIHMIINTQYPYIYSVNNNIREYFSTHIAFKTRSYFDSIVVLGRGGADELLGNGDMLINTPLISSLDSARLQGCDISKEEIANVIDYLKNNYLD